MTVIGLNQHTYSYCCLISHDKVHLDANTPFT